MVSHGARPPVDARLQSLIGGKGGFARIGPDLTRHILELAADAFSGRLSDGRRVWVTEPGQAYVCLPTVRALAHHGVWTVVLVHACGGCGERTLRPARGDHVYWWMVESDLYRGPLPRVQMPCVDRSDMRLCTVCDGDICCFCAVRRPEFYSHPVCRWCRPFCAVCRSMRRCECGHSPRKRPRRALPAPQ